MKSTWQSHDMQLDLGDARILPQVLQGYLFKLEAHFHELALVMLAQFYVQAIDRSPRVWCEDKGHITVS